MKRGIARLIAGHVHDFLNPREFDMIDHIGIALPYLYVLGQRYND